MSNEQNTQKSALEIFVEETSNHYALERRLAYLLGDRSYFSYTYSDKGDYGHLTLAEFQEHFDWDEKYSVETSWSVSVCNPVEESYECSSLEEALAYTNREKDFEEPDLCSYYPEVELDCYCPDTIALAVEIDNLRLKPQQPKSKTWKLFFEVSADSSLEETDLDSFCGQVAQLGERVVKPIKVVSSDLSEGDSPTPTWAEVIGQK